MEWVATLCEENQLKNRFVGEVRSVTRVSGELAQIQQWKERYIIASS